MWPALTMSMPPRLGGYWVIALSLAAQAWPPSNEAPRPVTRPGAWIVLDILSVRRRCPAGDTPGVGQKKAGGGRRGLGPISGDLSIEAQQLFSRPGRPPIKRSSAFVMSSWLPARTIQDLPAPDAAAELPRSASALVGGHHQLGNRPPSSGTSRLPVLIP